MSEDDEKLLKSLIQRNGMGKVVAALPPICRANADATSNSIQHSRWRRAERLLQEVAERVANVWVSDWCLSTSTEESKL